MFRKSLIILVLAVVYLLIQSGVAAQPFGECEPGLPTSTQTWRSGTEELSFTTPTDENAYSICPQRACCERIYTEGFDPDWVLTGWLELQYSYTNACDNGGPIPARVPIQRWEFRDDCLNNPPSDPDTACMAPHTGGEFELWVCYPPVREWKSAELHVDLAFLVSDDGVPVDWIGNHETARGVLGPGGSGVAGQDWDPYCKGFRGCTPGYWKNHTDDWCLYGTDEYYDEVFGAGPHITLLEAVRARGNKNCQALLRHSVAALLNASCYNDGSLCAWQYQYTEWEILDAVNRAMDSGDCNGVKDMLVESNERFCQDDDLPSDLWLFCTSRDAVNGCCEEPCNPNWQSESSGRGSRTGQSLFEEGVRSKPGPDRAKRLRGGNRGG